MKGNNNDIADTKGFGVWMLQFVTKTLVFIPGAYLNIKQAAKERRLGWYFYSLGYGGDIWGNKFIAPHANAHWITKEGYRFGLDEPISKPLAINVYNWTLTRKMIKYVKSVEIPDKNHLAKTLRSHGVEFDPIVMEQNIKKIMSGEAEKEFIELEKRLREVERKNKVPFMHRYKLAIMLSFYLVIAIPLTIQTFPHPIAIGFDVLVPVFIWLVVKK